MPDPGAGRASEPALAPRSAGSLILSTTPAFATRWLIPRRGRFYAQYPDISLRLDTSTALIELHEDASVDLVIRYGTGESPNLHSQCLLDECFGVYGTPAVVAGWGPQCPN